MRGWWERFFWTPLRDVQEQQRVALEAECGGTIDWEVVLVMTSSAVLLSLQYYLVRGQTAQWALQESLNLLPLGQLSWLRQWVVAAPNREIVRLGCWAAVNVALYVVVPVLVIKLLVRRPLRDYGVRLHGATRSWYVYAAMFLVMLPLLFLASLRDSFQHCYPFYRLIPGEHLWPRFFAWELLYAVQFVALEFFFRGFMVHGTRRRLGVYSVLAMTVPYCMIHFGKPMPETLAAIAAGIILGFMSLKTGSVWLGGALHIAVAWTMDALALTR